ncbi:MAG: hypothetical protein ACFFG0_32500 [Candidatus Thorarchaeota archaeon]
MIKYKISLFSQYPRMVGFPIKVKVIYSLMELNNFISENINKHDLHLSLYSFNTIIREIGKPDYLSANVDKVWLDVDKGNWIQSLRKLDNFCLDNDISHRLHLSSYSGSQFFMGCIPTIEHKKMALYNAQSYLVKKLKIPMEEGAITSFGDTARSFRIPNTYHFSKKCYCVPITSKELQTFSAKELIELTKKPRKTKGINFWEGSKLMNLEPFDKNEYMFDIKNQIEVNIDNVLDNEQLDKLNIPYKKFPLCIQDMLNTPNLGFLGRYLLVLYLRDQRYIELSDTEIISILKNVLDENTWLHCSTKRRVSGHNIGEDLLPIKYALSRLDKNIPYCVQLRNQGFCNHWSECSLEHPIF